MNCHLKGVEAKNIFLNNYWTLNKFWEQLLTIKTVACTINIYDRRFYNGNDIGLYYKTLEMIVIDDPSLS